MSCNIREIININKVNDNVFISKILPGFAKCTLTTPMSSYFSSFTPLGQLIRSLRIRNERTRSGYVRSQSYDPVECLAKVVHREICPRFSANSFSPFDLFKADCEAEELVQGLHLVSLMKALKKLPGIKCTGQQYVMNPRHEPLTSSTSEAGRPDDQLFQVIRKIIYAITFINNTTLCQSLDPL